LRPQLFSKFLASRDDDLVEDSKWPKKLGEKGGYSEDKGMLDLFFMCKIAKKWENTLTASLYIHQACVMARFPAWPSNQEEKLIYFPCFWRGRSKPPPNEGFSLPVTSEPGLVCAKQTTCEYK
jgi:hypothetical protein